MEFGASMLSKRWADLGWAGLGSPRPPRFAVALSNAAQVGHFGDRRVVFHGINKSGSLALANVMREAYRYHRREREFFSIYHRHPPDVASMVRLIEENRQGHRFFVGHYLYGAVDESGDRKAWITQFRHPLPRVVSCYQWMKRGFFRSHRTIEGFPDLETFVRRTAGKRRSQIVQFLPNGGARAPGISHLPAQDIFDIAVDALENKLAFVGLAEYFEETIFMLAHLCQLPTVAPWKKDMRNKGRALVTELPQSTVDLIQETFQYDFQLYDRAKRIFQERLKAITFGPDFAAYQKHCQGEYKDRIV
jgi:hypothetical protein